MRVMEVLQQRIASHIGECSGEDLACLDDYYVTRLCGDTEKRVILMRMADLEIGFQEATKQYLPLMVRLQESFQREVPDAFRWSLPRNVRDYLERLKLLGLKDSAPWTLGDFITTARSTLRTTRAA